MNLIITRKAYKNRLRIKNNHNFKQIKKMIIFKITKNLKKETRFSRASWKNLKKVHIPENLKIQKIINMNIKLNPKMIIIVIIMIAHTKIHKKMKIK